jgi:uncharacterized membrane protein YccC
MAAHRSRAGLRRAARAALVIPAVFALAKFVIGDPQVMLFAAFGCFALLVLADFGGVRRPRAVAYLTTTLMGAALIALGTLASPFVGAATLAMLLAGFCIQFVSVFGGYAAAAQPALLLSFVLAVSVPAPSVATGGRLFGWLIAGLASTLASLVLWPRFERVALRRSAALACVALADLVEAQRSGQASAVAESRAREAVEEVGRAYASTPKRPAGPARRDRALAELLTELQRFVELATRSFGQLGSESYLPIEEGELLAAEVVKTLRASASVLTGEEPPDLIRLTEVRLSHRQALDRWAAAALRAGRSPEEVLRGLDADHKLRVLSYLALALGANAVIAAGRNPDVRLRLPAGTPRFQGASGVAFRVVQTVRTHLEPTSSVLHNSARVAVGLALAVLLARLLRLEHAFWVVLGALSVLRSNALATGRSTLEALAGTTAGFAVGAVLAVAAGHSLPALWAALPVTVFLAAYAPSAIGFVIGQAAFTLNLIILFNLISPAGWQVGLIRIQDVAVGAVISIVTGLLLWPRGARAELRRAVASLYRAVATFLDSSFARLLDGGSAGEGHRLRHLAVRARDRAGEALDTYINERGAKPLSPETGAQLVASATHAILVGDLLNVVFEAGYQAGGCREGTEVLRRQVQLGVDSFLVLADRLDLTFGGERPLPRVSDGVLRKATLLCLRRWKDDQAVGRSAIAVVAAGEWLRELSRLSADLERPVKAAIAAGRVAWWR